VTSNGWTGDVRFAAIADPLLDAAGGYPDAWIAA
jgi:hypothetical protein